MQKKKPGAILTLDFARAYDRVDSNMLYAILAKFGFSADFVRIVQNLYEGCKSRVIINGDVGDGIPMNRGLKQGCPLAALLYLIYIEPLHLTLQGSIKGTRIGSQTVTSLGFIDDIVLLIDSDYDFMVTQDILLRFEQSTNSKINRKKNQIVTLWCLERPGGMASELAQARAHGEDSGCHVSR